MVEFYLKLSHLLGALVNFPEKGCHLLLPNAPWPVFRLCILRSLAKLSLEFPNRAKIDAKLPVPIVYSVPINSAEEAVLESG